jgi:hypothetical protein
MKAVLLKMQMSLDLMLEAVWLFGYWKHQYLFTMQQGAITRRLEYSK